VKIVLAGGTGFLGASILNALLGENHEVVLLSRNPRPGDAFSQQSFKYAAWDGKTVAAWAEHVSGASAVINLAGEPIGVKRWSDTQKSLIVGSRVESTRAIIAAMAAANPRPSILINASAIGFYGHVAEGDVSETRKKGNGHLADTCEKWEHHALAAQNYGVRVVILRYGIVLERDGGVLAKMLVPFKMFAGGPPGSGRQWVSWIHREDAVRATLFCLENSKLAGPVNVTSPEPERMKEFCTAMARAIGRPSWAPVPDFVLKTILGEMSDVILTGQRAIPRKLIEAGFKFKYPHIGSAFGAIFSSNNNQVSVS
jgi:uncharacterized protein (TIGR01777 family)